MAITAISAFKHVKWVWKKRMQCHKYSVMSMTKVWAKVSLNSPKTILLAMAHPFLKNSAFNIS